MIEEETSPVQDNKLQQTTSALIYPLDEESLNLSPKIHQEDKFLYEDRFWDQDELISQTLELLQMQDKEQFKSEWSWLQFQEFFIYHIAFYLIGPLVVLLFQNRELMINLNFLGFNSLFLRHLCLWIFLLFSLLTYIFTSHSIIELSDFIFIWIAVIIRSIIIASKFATFSSAKCTLYKIQVIKNNQFMFDEIIDEWRSQTADILLLEQVRCLKRHQFEVSLYKIDFMVPLGLDTQSNIKNTQINYQTEYKIDLKNNQYCGFQIFGYLVNKYQEIHPSKNFLIQSLIESIGTAGMPIFLRLDLIMWGECSSWDIFRLIINFLVAFQAFYGFFLFIHLTFYDQGRRFFLVQQCLYMIKSNAQRYFYEKYIPTINFSNFQTLQAWSMLRALCFDYGQSYTLRQQGFFMILFLGFISIMYQQFFKQLLSQTFQLELWGELSLFIIIFNLYYLFLGATSNSFYSEFEVSLQEVKSVYQDILRMKNSYLDLGVEPQNFVHKKFLRLLKTYVKSDKVEFEFVINGIIREIDDNLRLLSNDQRNNPFKFFGVVITFNLLKSGIVGLSTIFSYSLQQKMLRK
ncbi:hypothetical protein pb186bvf_004177 [Paramecium bursaria]